MDANFCVRLAVYNFSSKNGSLWHHLKSLSSKTSNYSFNVNSRAEIFEKSLAKMSRCDALLEGASSECLIELRHLQGETKTQLFKCEFCSKSFQRSYTLKRHLRSHLPNPKRYECEVCGRAYMHRYHLKRHFKAHCGKVSTVSVSEGEERGGLENLDCKKA